MNFYGTQHLWRKHVDEFFDNNGFFGSHSLLFGKNAKNLMKTDIRETDDAKAYRFAVELPGFKKDKLSLDIKDGYLTVAAKKGLDKDEQDKKGRVLRQERYAGGWFFTASGAFSRRRRYRRAFLRRTEP